jgi:tetratricopeptide (TPR) repeat protein
MLRLRPLPKNSDIMPHPFRVRIYSGLVILISLAILAFLTNSPLRGIVDDAVDYYQDLSTPDTEGVPVALEKPSPGEIAHNENYYGIGRLETRDYKGAIEKFISATTLDPEVPEYHANLAIAYEKNGQHEDAIDQLKIVLKSQPDNPDFLSLLGNAHFGQDQWAEAAEAYGKALLLGIDDHKVLFNAAQVYLEVGALKRASDAIDAAISLKGDDADYHVTLGIIRHNAMRYEDAIDAFEAARKIAPGRSGIDEWIQHASQKLEDESLKRTAPRTDIRSDRYPLGTSPAKRREIDAIYRRMEKLKEDFMRSAK